MCRTMQIWGTACTRLHVEVQSVASCFAQKLLPASEGHPQAHMTYQEPICCGKPCRAHEAQAVPNGLPSHTEPKPLLELDPGLRQGT